MEVWAVVCSSTESVDTIGAMVRRIMNAARKDNNSTDSVEDTNHTALSPPEFLNSLTVRLR